MEDIHHKMTPLLSPVMESELLKQPWPLLENSQNRVATGSTSAFWEENFQDLSDWCAVDPQNRNQFHTELFLQESLNCHIGEQITSKNSGVKDNYSNLSNQESGLAETATVGDSCWSVDNNIQSTGMSLEDPLHVGQDQFNVVTNISDGWLNFLPITSMNEPQTIVDDAELILGTYEDVPEASLDLINETIGTWIPITIDNDITCNDLVINNHCTDNDVILDIRPSTSDNFTDDNCEKKQLLRDVLLTADVASESFDLLSYVCDEDKNYVDEKNSAEKPDVPSSTAKPAQVKITNKSKSPRKRKLKQVKVKAEPYVPPSKIHNNKNVSDLVHKRASNQINEEMINDADSDSDAHSSDFNYRELREKNNQASRKSRINKKVKESEMLKNASKLEKDNIILKMKVEQLEKLVASIRTALLQSALKKET